MLSFNFTNTRFIYFIFESVHQNKKKKSIKLMFLIVVLNIGSDQSIIVPVRSDEFDQKVIKPESNLLN